MNPLALAATTALLAASVGCSADAGAPAPAERTEPPGLSAVELARQVLAQVRPDDPAAHLEATCAGGLVARTGATQECDLGSGGDEVAVLLTASDDSGRRFELEPFLRGEDVAAAVVATLRRQGRTGAVVACPADLAGRVGETTECSVELGGEDGTLVVEVTKVDGLMIDFDFRST